MEVASLAPNAEVTIYPWKDSPEHIDEVVEHARRFLKAHVPVAASRLCGRDLRRPAASSHPAALRAAGCVRGLEVSGGRRAPAPSPMNSIGWMVGPCSWEHGTGSCGLSGGWARLVRRFGSGVPASTRSAGCGWHGGVAAAAGALTLTPALLETHLRRDGAGGRRGRAPATNLYTAGFHG